MCRKENVGYNEYNILFVKLGYYLYLLRPFSHLPWVFMKKHTLENHDLLIVWPWVLGHFSSLSLFSHVK